MSLFIVAMKDGGGKIKPANMFLTLVENWMELNYCTITVVAFCFFLWRGGCPIMILFKLDLPTPGGVVLHEVNFNKASQEYSNQSNNTRQSFQWLHLSTYICECYIKLCRYIEYIINIEAKVWNLQITMRTHCQIPCQVIVCMYCLQVCLFSLYFHSI